ncbi:MAG: hypothetical protein K0Q73_5155 [Paenibacillus sp.]|jgi:hypothetical protein|nr:hypothetical protein [Paenibacillus sp.]
MRTNRTEIVGKINEKKKVMSNSHHLLWHESRIDSEFISKLYEYETCE